MIWQRDNPIGRPFPPPSLEWIQHDSSVQKQNNAMEPNIILYFHQLSQMIFRSLVARLSDAKSKTQRQIP